VVSSSDLHNIDFIFNLISNQLRSSSINRSLFDHISDVDIKLDSVGYKLAEFSDVRLSCNQSLIENFENLRARKSDLDACYCKLVNSMEMN
jgi:hypothetical protein